MCNNKSGEGHDAGFCFSKHSHQALRISFWVLVVLGFVTALGLGSEAIRFAASRGKAMNFARAGYSVQPTADGYRVLPRMQQVFRQEPAKQPAMIYGKVVKVEGAQITILNNASVEQVVLSTAETSISIGGKEYGISNVEKDDEGVFGGFVNKQNQLEAKVIELK